MYEVIVGNIGSVYSGDDYSEACRIYGEYCHLSSEGYGRADGESVFLLEDGEPAEEFVGFYDRQEQEDHA